MGKDIFRGPLEQVDDCCWRIPKSYKHGMRVDGLIFASGTILNVAVMADSLLPSGVPALGP